MSGCGTCACAPVGTGTNTNGGTHTIVNVGDGAESFVIGTGPNPFELRTIISPLGSVDIVQTADEIQLEVTGENVGLFIQIYVDGSVGPFQWRSLQSSDSTVSITQNLTDIDFKVDIDSLMSLDNVGAGAEVWVDPSGPNPFNLRSVRSPLGTVAVVQTVDEIQLEVSDPGGGAVVFQVDGTAVKSTGLGTYQLVEILATDPAAQIKDGANWKINLCILVCHPTGLFSINTWVRWSIETAVGVFTPIDEWQINWPITILVDEPSAPAHRTVDVEVEFDDPRMLCEVRMSVLTGAATQVELPRWGGVEISPAP